MKKPINYYLYKLKRFEIIGVSSVVILSVLVLSYYFLLPNLSKAQEIYSRQKQLRTRLTVLRKKDELLSSIDSKVYQDNINKLTGILPGSKDYVSLFNTFDNLQMESGVTILKTDLQFGSISTVSGKLKKDTLSSAFIIPVKVEILGDIDQINKFIYSLNDLNNRIITVNKISWNSKADGLYTVSLEGNSYFYPLPSKIGSIDAPLIEINEEQQKILDIIAAIAVQTEEEGAFVPLGKPNLFN